MTPALLLGVLRRRASLRRLERWSREELEIYQARSLRRLRDFVYAESPFYSRHHRKLFDAPLHEVPPVTKAQLMGAFDEAVTNRDLCLDDLESHVKTMGAGDRLADRWCVASTSGSTGLRGLFPWSDDEWMQVLASYARANEWAGLHVDLFRHLKVGVVSSRVPWHQSALVGAALASEWYRPFVSTLRNRWWSSRRSSTPSNPSRSSRTRRWHACSPTNSSQGASTSRRAR